VSLLNPLPTNEEEPCKYCEQAKVMPYMGWYFFPCVSCCARFVLAMPDPDRVELAYIMIRRQLRNPGIERIQKEVERLQALRLTA